MSDHFSLHTPIARPDFKLTTFIPIGMPEVTLCDQAPAFVQRFHNVTIYTDGAIRQHDGTMLAGNFVSNPYIDFTAARPASDYRQYPMVYAHSSGNFGHAVFEGLPRLAVLAMAGYRGRTVAVSRVGKLQPFLDLLAWPYLEVDLPYGFSDVVVPSCPVGRAANGRPFAWSDALWWVRLKLMPVTPSRSYRLYCRRTGATARNVLNDDEVCNTLEKYGFTLVDLSTMPLADQIKIVAGAEIIVAAGGANSGMCGLFAHCPVIELFPPAGAHVFASLIYCSEFGLPYQRLNGIPDSDSKDANYTIDIASLERLIGEVEQMIGKVGKTA